MNGEPGIVAFVIEAVLYSGVFILVHLVVRQVRGDPFLQKNPDPFRRFDVPGALAIAFAAFVGQQVGMTLVGLGGDWRLVGILFALNVGVVAYHFGVRRVTRPIGSVRRGAYQGAVVLWAALPVVYGAAMLVSLLGGYEQQQKSVRYLEQPGWQYWAFLVVVVAPLLEEIAFRGLLYPALRRRWGVHAAVIVSSVLFGLIHGQVNVIMPLALLGVFLAYLVETTGSLVPCVVAHALFNGLTVFQSALQ